MPDTLAAYEKKTNKTVIDWTTKQPTKPNRIHRVPELVANPLSVPNIGYDMSRAWAQIIPTDYMAQCIENDTILYSRPVLASTNPVSRYMPQYMFTAMKFAYRGGRPPLNATPAEMFASCIGGFSVHFDIWNIVESVSTSIKEGKHLVVKLVDVTEQGKPPMPMYVPMAELNASRRNWTFDDYSYKTAPKIAASRQYELWCRLAPGTNFFPVKAVAYSAAALLLGLSIAQLWWVHFRTLSVSKEQCRDAIRLKDEMMLAKQASDEHSAAKSAFVASVSHEIRTPMNGVLGMLGLLVDTTKLTPTQDDYARTALSSGKALLSLVNDILDLSKIESGCMELESIPFNPAEEMDGILSMFGERSRGKGLELAVLVHEGLPTQVMGDPGRFRQVIINLVGNSLKFVNRGHIFIRIMALPDNEETAKVIQKFHSGSFSGELLPQSDGEHESLATEKKGQTLSGFEVANVDCCWPSVQKCSSQQAEVVAMIGLRPGPLRLLIWVEDSGIGIPDSARERIFKPFMQADKATSRNYGGTGIGLNISKKLVELMSGKLDFTSAVNFGTTFRLDIRSSLPQKIGGMSAQNSQRPSLAHGVADATSSVHGGMMTMAPSSCVSPITSSIASSTAFCIDNNALRAHVTCHYLQRMGMAAYPIVVQFPVPSTSSRWRRSRLGPREAPECLKPASLPALMEGMGPLPAPTIIFLEMEPSQGSWLSSSSEMPPTSTAHSSPGIRGLADVGRTIIAQLQGGPTEFRLSDMKQRLTWARGLAAQLAGGDLCEERAERGGGGGAASLPVVLVSNVQSAELEEFATAAGFAAVVVKPLRRVSLNACMQAILRRDCREGVGGKLTPLEDKDEPAEDDSLADLTKAVSGKKILVVDDNIVNRKVASKVLEKYDIVVTCRTNGEEALEAVMGEHQFDIILTDIQMPLMDGFEATREIRKAEAEGRSKGPYLSLGRSGVPIFAVTADVMKGSLEKCLETGMNGIVPKPIEEQRLLALIIEHLQPVESTIGIGTLSDDDNSKHSY